LCRCWYEGRDPLNKVGFVQRDDKGGSFLKRNPPVIGTDLPDGRLETEFAEPFSISCVDNTQQNRYNLERIDSPDCPKNRTGLL